MSSKDSEEGRRVRRPRRLLSTDSTKTSSSRQSSSDVSLSDDDTRKHNARGHSKFSPLSQLDEVPQEELEGWMRQGIVDSPLNSPENPFDVPLPRSESPKPAKPKLEIRTGPSLLAKASSASDNGPLPSPGAARWDHIRQHVLPSSAVFSGASRAPSTHVTSSSTSSTQNTSRAPTPKASRFVQRLGFKQAAEHAREVVVDENRKFSYELQKVCWLARHDEPSSAVKIEQHGTPYLPFMSSTSLNMHAPSISMSQSNKRHDMRRQSMQSLSSSPQTTSSLKQLYHVLLLHSTPSPDGREPAPQLPLQKFVLSTLLIPFLTLEKDNRLDEERWFAIEAFEIIRKTWHPLDEIEGIERSMWCIKAALIPPAPIRMRLVTSLWHLTVPPESLSPATSPTTLQGLCQGLFSLLPWVQLHTEEGKLLTQIIYQVRTGSCGEIHKASIESEFNASLVNGDTVQTIRDAVVVEALGKCMENSTDADRRWLLVNFLEEHWPIPPQDLALSSVLDAIHSRKLNVFTRVFCSLLESTSPESNRRVNDAHHVIKFLQTRAIPELELLSAKNLEAKCNVIKCILIMLMAEDMNDVVRWCISIICRWYRNAGSWKDNFNQGLKHIITEGLWQFIIVILTSLAEVLPQDVRKPVIAFMLPLLNDRLVDNPPPHPCLPLTALFNTLSQAYPQIFYKPLFLCAASVKEIAVVNHLCTITIMSRFLPDFWVRDAEMISVAVMSDIGGGGDANGKGKAKEGAWGNARLGQSVLLVELIGKVQGIRREKENTSIPEAALVDMIKFAIELEARLTLMLQTKERTFMVPPSQRLLFCVLFREIRLLTRSMKGAPWLPQIVSWYIDYHNDPEQDAFNDEVNDAVTIIQSLFVMAQDAHSHKRRSTRLLSFVLDPAIPNANNGSEIFSVLSQRSKLIKSLSKGYISRAMKLLVTMSLLLTPENMRRIGPIVWQHYLDETETSVLASACYLIMQCAEKTSVDLQALVETDLASADYGTKLRAVQRVSTLSTWRFQIASQHVVSDRQHRPFRLARGPLPFIATDMGSSQYVREDDSLETKDNLPLEMRKRLAEIGWVEDDTPINQQIEWIRTPMSLLPIQQLDRLDFSNAESFPSSPIASPISSPQQGSPTLGDTSDEVALLRRNSSSGGPMYGVKRRAVFVPALTRIFPLLVSMAFDEDFTIACSTRSTVLDLMRNDAALLARPVLDLLAEGSKDISAAVDSLRALLHVRRNLPPSMAHHIFNYLAGFLKHNAKNAITKEALLEYAYIIPIIAKLVPQVSDLSLRDFRRAKIDTYFVPSGALWFPPNSNPFMFPDSSGGSENSLNEVSPRLIAVTMIRISQNILFLDLLKKNPQDVQLVRKSMSRLVLPSMDDPYDARALELKDFIPRKGTGSNGTQSRGSKLRAMSVLLSRSYLPLVAQVFRSMSRHLNDRSELAVLVEGLNRILLVHGSDIGIVSQALIAFMVASTRFHRLFISRGGYTLFMPVIIKVYTEADNLGIRMAIEYAVNRFFAHHREAFVYQSMDAMAHIMATTDIEAEWVAESVYALFSSLRKMISPATQDAAGIHNSNKLQEREALLVLTAEEKPQTFLASLRPSGGQGKTIPIDIPEEYEAKRLTVDNFVRLFLTVIAHDLTIIRSEQFLRFLRFLTPHLYHASSSARNVLQQGVEALGMVLLRASSKNKAESSSRLVEGDPQEVAIDEILDQQLHEKSKTPSDFVSMRLQYLYLIVAFTRAGGHLSMQASHRNLELVKLLLRESTSELDNAISSFLADYMKSAFEQDPPRDLKGLVAFLKDLAPVVSSYSLTINFSGLFEATHRLCTNPQYAKDPGFSQLVVTQICSAGLKACALAATEKLLLTLPCRISLVNLASQSVFLWGADIMAEVEKHKPTYDFLAGVLLPFALSMKTATDIDMDRGRLEPWHREAHARAWVRLLSYTMLACQKTRRLADTVLSRERSKSQERTPTLGRKKEQLWSFVTALQVLKIIIIRAPRDLTSSLPDVWVRIATFLRSMLSEGSAEFASMSRDYSPSPSPTPSPRSSGLFNATFSHSSSFPPSLHRNSLLQQIFHSPRMVDYCLWSVFELLCIHRTPLVLQMRLFMQEKVLGLDQDLKSQSTFSLSKVARPVSSVFAKPRRRSGLQSPGISPRIHPSNSLSIQDGGLFSLYSNRQSTPSPMSTPTFLDTHRIVHLGLTHQGHSLPVSSRESGQSQAKTTQVRSLSLIKATYRRIRIVQSYMGYQSMLFPLPGEGESGQDVSPSTWTKIQALQEVVRETQELIEEFEESQAVESETTITDVDQSLGR
ncbi:uncharacterized protein BT62DRAFT_929572 [Guyanagaster necrorhizus]|uniref:Protein UNC80 C-terminal domain-containing protein n=1 Tax=Guyanagaster necrorhizus TaxID=856835 RepID=A0A9P8AUH6_9AGAR|nr:uncharacterized protein BT62DRAFT_929572 [Guyanagaster necrorhizus MCA 3950]KAG7448488.1 hypothetical protein BT62DRAFT_929572 [Guyanagaster necrorhizus MCA 3950]